MNKATSTVQRKEINASVRQFILSQFPSARRRALLDTEPLLQSGIIDSLGVLDVVAFIEAEFKIIVDDDDLIPEHFQSIEQITTFIEKKSIAETGPR